jgi:hypothetical protein
VRNGAAITVLQNGEVYIRCFHSTCQWYGAGQGEHLGTLFDEVTPDADLIAPGGTAAPAPRIDREVAEGGGQQDESSLEITIRAMQAATTPQPMGKCLREVMRQIQRGDSGPLSDPTLRPQPSQEDRPESCEDLRQVEDWLAADGSRHPPWLNACRALKPLLATNTFTATNSQYQQVRGESWPKGSEQSAVATTVWECRPQDACLTVPVGKRPCVGHALLAGAARFVSVGADSLSDSLPGQIPVPGVRDNRCDWAGEDVRVGALNVGFKGMAASAVGITQLLHSSRCDILFLTDIRTTRSKIGRTRRMLEGALFNEWHLLANISGA